MDFTIDNIWELKSAIQRLKEEIDNIPMNEKSVNTHGGGYIFSLLEKAGVSSHKIKKREIIQKSEKEVNKIETHCILNSR